MGIKAIIRTARAARCQLIITSLTQQFTAPQIHFIIKLTEDATTDMNCRLYDTHRC